MINQKNRKWVGLNIVIVIFISGIVSSCGYADTGSLKKDAAISTEVSQQKASEQKETEQKQDTSEKRTDETAVRCQKVYKGYISSKEEAWQAIKEEGEKQRQNYYNPDVTVIEEKMEKEFQIAAVNLGEMSVDMAQNVYQAFTYMYDTYPVLQGSLTNVTLGNFDKRSGGKIAETEKFEFVIYKEYGVYPYVEKYQIVLGANTFLNDAKLKEMCQSFQDSGYWPKNATPSAVVVHELGHQLLEVIIQRQFGLKDAYYITEENGEAFAYYNTDGLSSRQTVVKQLLKEAYEIWKREYKEEGEFDVFRESISDYALGKQQDGGYSYSETCAEAVADVYLNGEEAAPASKVIIEVMKQYLELE